MRKFELIIMILFISSGLYVACNSKQIKDKTSSKASRNNNITLITLDPGHFHAALVQKIMCESINPIVYVYAPQSDDLKSHLKIIEGYNVRENNPTLWNEVIYTGSDYLERMLTDKPGNLVIISGNNQIKTDYIKKSVNAGLNVLSDKPMVITPEKFAELEEIFKMAKEKGALLYDIMPERYEINTMLQKELSLDQEIFGTLQDGSPEEPATEQISIHHFYKDVSGNALVRPAWFFDVKQQGEGIVDVTTHLVDLVQWCCFQNQIINKSDIKIIAARRWPTVMNINEFSVVTKLDKFPEFLSESVINDKLNVFSNGEIIYKIKNKVAKVSVEWKFKASETPGDTHYSVMRGTSCMLEIRQGKEEGFDPVLYITANEGTDIKVFEKKLKNGILKLPQKNIEIQKIKNNVWKTTVPKELIIDHEDRFAIVVKKYLEYLKNGNIPKWEIAAMISKYYTTTSALQMATEN